MANYDDERELRAVPYVESPPIDTFSPEVDLTIDEKPHFIGFAISFLHPHQILKHAVISNPWLSILSHRVGLIRRASPDFYENLTEKQLRYQKTFQLAFTDILAMPGETSTDS